MQLSNPPQWRNTLFSSTKTIMLVKDMAWQWRKKSNRWVILRYDNNIGIWEFCLIMGNLHVFGYFLIKIVQRANTKLLLHRIFTTGYFSCINRFQTKVIENSLPTINSFSCLRQFGKILGSFANRHLFMSCPISFPQLFPLPKHFTLIVFQGDILDVSKIRLHHGLIHFN